jgi:hypothetical protein
LALWQDEAGSSKKDEPGTAALAMDVDGSDKDSKDQASSEQEKKTEEAAPSTPTPATMSSSSATVGGLSAEAKDVADMARTLAPTVSFIWILPTAVFRCRICPVFHMASRFF